MSIHQGPAAELAPLLAVPPRELESFGEVRERLAARMDQAVFRRPDLGVLLGDLAPSALRELHRQHVAFMHSVLTLGLPDLLFAGLPGVYRGYVGRGLSSDYLDAAPDLWVRVVDDELGRSCEGLVRLHQWMARRPGLWIPGPSIPDATLDPESPAGRLLTALLQSDPTGARGTVRSELARGLDLITVFTEVVQPALHEIGVGWESGRITTAQEHLASAMVARILAELAQDLPGAGPLMAVVAAAPDDPHEFGAWIVADVLRSGGWEVRFLGAALPASEIAGYVKGTRPDLLALSATLPIHLPGVRDLIHELRCHLDTRRIPVLVGGQAFAAGEPVWRATGADGFAADAGGILEAAARLVPPTQGDANGRRNAQAMP